MSQVAPFSDVVEDRSIAVELHIGNYGLRKYSGDMEVLGGVVYCWTEGIAYLLDILKDLSDIMDPVQIMTYMLIGASYIRFDILLEANADHEVYG